MLASLFKKSPPPPEPPPAPQLCMVCLKGERGLTPDRILRAWSKFFPKLPPISHKGTSPDAPASPTARGDSAVIELSIPSSAPNTTRTIMIAVLPMPIPGNDIPAACETSWMWPDAAQRLSEHRAHAVILTSPTKDPLHEAIDISRIAACVAAAGEGLAIYWGNASQVHKPRFFLDALTTFASSPSAEPPSMLWVGLRISASTPDGKPPYTLTTQGMSSFAHRELEITNTNMPLGDLRLLATSTTAYLLKRGQILKHNQTFGRTPTEKFQVEHTTSHFRPGEPVLRLHVP